jgi:signal transduction histidine kinase
LEIIEEILDFTSIEAGDLEIECAEFDPREVIADVAAKYEPAAGVKGLEFTGSAADSLPPAMLGDRRRLGQVLSLLLGNAIKFTDAGFVRLDALAPATGEIEFRISDSGIGIAPDKREIIFEPFRQGDGTPTRRHGGTGLGLTIAKRLVDGMGGRIDFESEVGRGTTFRVTLPLGGPASSPDA